MTTSVALQAEGYICACIAFSRRHYLSWLIHSTIHPNYLAARTLETFLERSEKASVPMHCDRYILPRD